VKLNLAGNPTFATWCTNRFFYRCENLLDLDLSGLAFNEIQFKSVQQNIMDMKLLQKLNLSNFYDKKSLSNHTSQANLQCLMLLILGSKSIRTLILRGKDYLFIVNLCDFNSSDVGPYLISSIFNEWGGVGSNLSKLDFSNNQLSTIGMRLTICLVFQFNGFIYFFALTLISHLLIVRYPSLCKVSHPEQISQASVLRQQQCDLRRLLCHCCVSVLQ
jgi:hypothetical protein